MQLYSCWVTWNHFHVSYKLLHGSGTLFTAPAECASDNLVIGLYTEQHTMSEMFSPPWSQFWRVVLSEVLRSIRFLHQRQLNQDGYRAAYNMLLAHAYVVGLLQHLWLTFANGCGPVAYEKNIYCPHVNWLEQVMCGRCNMDM